MDKCFANRNGKCTVLVVRRCRKKACSFYKNKSEYKKDQDKIISRIKRLDMGSKKYITEKYYGGVLGVVE